MAFRIQLIDGISGENTFTKPKSQVGNPRRKLKDQLRNVEIFARRPNRSESTFKVDNDDDGYELASCGCDQPSEQEGRQVWNSSCLGL